MLYGLAEARRLLHAGGDEAAAGGGRGLHGRHRLPARRHRRPWPPMGTALTEEQMEALWRLHTEPTLCFDGDSRRPARPPSAPSTARCRVLKAGRSFQFRHAHGRQGPGRGAARAGRGGAEARNCGRPRPSSRPLFVRERDAEPLDTPERRAGVQAASAHGGRPRSPTRTLPRPTARSCSARFDALFARPPTPRHGPACRLRAAGHGDRPSRMRRSTPEGRAGGAALRRALDPLPAAVAQLAIADPACARPASGGARDARLRRSGAG